MHEHNPQAEQMGDEAMARNLAHQAQAIWPQERLLFDRYGLSGPLRVVDVGCGTGEITRRLAARYVDARVLGFDLIEANLARARDLDARESPADVAARIEYRLGDAFHLPLEAGSVHLLVCRHMSQAVPSFAAVLREFARVLSPGGRLHLLSEDYGMLHFPVPPGARDGGSDAFWQQVVLPFLSSIDCDGRVGRHSPALLADAGFTAITMDYVTVDTLRVARPTFAGILRAWRDGYAGVLAEFSGRPVGDIHARFEAILGAIETPPAYAVWHVPVVSGQAADHA